MARSEGFENVLRGRVERLEETVASVSIAPGVVLRIPGEGLAGAREAVFCLRAEDLIVAVRPPEGLSAQNIVPGVVREIREAGSGGGADGPLLALVGLGAAEGRGAMGEGGAPVVVALTARACRQLALSPGVPVHIIFKTQACTVLAAR
jgi:molybdate transport system ATP-binding protein